MKNTDYSLDTLSTMISSDSLKVLSEMINELGLEIVGAEVE